MGALQKNQEQWMLRITKYADRLVDDLDTLAWPEEIKAAQRNWIGRSEGSEIYFNLNFTTNQKLNDNRDVDGNPARLSVFTTRADTLFGVTYIVLAPEHPWVTLALDRDHVGVIDNADEVRVYVEQSKKKSELDRQQSKEKTGVEIKGVKAINPANGEEIPIWVADYVLAGYGTGAVMAVPAHDERDFEFARKYHLSIMRVIDGNTDHGNVPSQYRANPSDYVTNIATAKDFCFTNEGILMHSGEFDGLNSNEARIKITDFVGGKMVKTYRLRDWGISRQRYWGTPIPIVYDPEGKAHSVPDEHLPWILPIDVDHTPDGTAPLARSKELFERTEKLFGKGWKPEVETMDTFIDSSWYFYRYLDNHNSEAFAAKEKIDAWMPINLYMGGAEHTTMHLLYSRFWVKAMKDCGLVRENEPYTVRRNRGIILGPDGNKMSKSKGNVINPDEIVERLGADTVRMYLAFMGPYGVTVNYPWDPNGVVGVRRFLERVWRLQFKIDKQKKVCKTDTLVQKTIKGVSQDIEEYKFNTAIAKMMILVNALEKEDAIVENSYKILLRILAPFAPHITEELWHELGETTSIHLEPWPTFDTTAIADEQVTVVIQINGKVRSELTVQKGTEEEVIKNLALSDEKIIRSLEGKTIQKIIYVKDRLLSIVV
jgi:leucyl-tRNA synthetase